LPIPPDPPLAPRPARRSVGRTPGLDKAIIAEETSADPTKAADQYRAAIARFDTQRADAAQAVFRLGECLRKLGRIEESKVQYARILREFVDEADLVKLSQKRLNESPAGAATQLAAPARESVDNLIAKEMDLVREQLAVIEERVANGVESSAALLPLRRELLRLEQERAIRAQPGASNYFPAVSDAQSRTLTAQEEDLRVVETELRKQRLELQKLRAVMNMIEKGPAETLTTRIIDDPRFQKLKQEYERLVTNAAAAPADAREGNEESRKQAQRRLQSWVNEIYQPELRSSVEFAENQINELSKQSAALADRIRRDEAELAEAQKNRQAEGVGGSLRSGVPAGR
jgi:hypothetical protein